MSKLTKKYFTMKAAGIIVLLFYSAHLFAQEATAVAEDYISACQYQKAIDYLEQRTDTSKEASLQKVLCYSYLQDYSKAIAVLLPLKEKYPADVQIIMQLASCYDKLSMTEESIACFDELIKMYPKNAYFIIRKADLLYRSQKYDEAIAAYKRAFEEYNSSNLPKQIAYSFGKMQQWDSAKVYINRALKIDSTDEKAKIELIKITVNQQDYSSALNLSDQFLSRDSDNIEVNNLKSLCYYQLNDYKHAIANLEHSRLLGDTSLFVNKYLGFSYFFTENDEKAYPCLARAFEQDSTNTNVLYALASVNQSVENYPEAIRLYEKLIQRVVPAYNTMYTYYKKLAASYEEDKEYQSAFENYKKALIYCSGNQNIELLFHLADISDVQLHDYPVALDYIISNTE
jgi:tetratricopeptide (TPR) repeat protein